MTLKRRTFLVVALTLACLLLILYAVGEGFIARGFVEAEREEMLTDLDRCRAAIDDDVATISDKLADWAYWDDTYAFAEAADKEYIKANLGVSSLRSLKVSGMILLSPEGEVKWAGQTVGEEDEIRAFPEDLVNTCRSVAMSEALSADQASVSGILTVAEGSLLFAARNILTSEISGPSHGSLVFVRWLDETTAERVARLTKTQVEICGLRDQAVRDDFAAAARQLQLGNTHIVMPGGSGSIAGYAAMNDYFGKPALVIRCVAPRRIVPTGRAALRWFYLSLGLTGLAFGFAVVGALKVIVLGRLSRLTEGVGAVGQSRDVARRVRVEGTDELAMLACGINAMLADLEIAQREARESEDRFRTLADQSPLIIWMSDAVGNTTFVSQTWLEFCGLTEDSQLGDGWSKCIHPADRSAVLTSYTEAICTRQRYSMEFRMRHKSGEYRWLLDTRMPRFRSDGVFVGMVGCCVDITSRKEAEERQYRQATELESAKADAVAANHAKSAFLANMSHEIRTPMTAILGFADLLAEEPASEDQRREHVETIRRSGEHLLMLINDILDLSKIDAGKMTAEAISFSPARLVGDVLSMLRPRAESKSLPLTAVFEGPIPRTVISDPTRLRQIIMNLVGNALKFTERGSVNIRVAYVANDGQSPRLNFEVSDTGPGMNEEQIARLFRPFTQADSSMTRKHGGTGLGLTISKHLAQLLGGDIQAECEVGKGCTFRATIAVANPQDIVLVDGNAELRSITTPSDAKSSAPRIFHGRVLLAEDGPDNQRLIVHHLRKAGAEVVVVDNGEKAVAAALAAKEKGEPFDTILMDMQMPIMDGYTAAATLRAQDYEGPILALTAHAMAQDRHRCLAAGCDDFATKPINATKLIELCIEWAERAKADRQTPGA